jgi:hypothetical protein
MPHLYISRNNIVTEKQIKNRGWCKTSNLYKPTTRVIAYNSMKVGLNRKFLTFNKKYLYSFCPPDEATKQGKWSTYEINEGLRLARQYKNDPNTTYDNIEVWAKISENLPGRTSQNCNNNLSKLLIKERSYSPK